MSPSAAYLSAVAVGQPVRVTVTFTVDGTVVDPTTVVFIFAAPFARNPVAKTTSTYNVVAQPITIVKENVGVYHADVVPTSGPGPWQWRFTGAGACDAAVDGTFDVLDSPLA